jgi:hypothetical protein
LAKAAGISQLVDPTPTKTHSIISHDPPTTEATKEGVDPMKGERWVWDPVDQMYVIQREDVATTSKPDTLQHDEEFSTWMSNNKPKPPVKQPSSYYTPFRYPTHYLDTGNEITYRNFIDRLALSDFEWSAVGEKGHAHFIEAVLKNQVPWIPHGTKIDNYLAPRNMVNGNESNYHSILNVADDNKTMKSRSTYLHALVNAPKNTEYVERFHPEHMSELSHGLSDDWTQPFKYRQNSVSFNHHLESQMDFDFSEHEL